MQKSDPARTELTTLPATAELSIRSHSAEDGSAAGQPGAAGQGLTGPLHSLRRNWLLGSVLGILAAGPLAGVTWYLHRLDYKAAALVRISPFESRVVFETADESGKLDYKTYKLTQRQLILAPNLLINALKKEGISEIPAIRNEADPVAWLQKNLEITFPDNAELMQVAVTSPDRFVAQRLVNAVVDTYDEEVVVADKNDRLRRVNNLDKSQAEAENKSRQKRQELRSLVQLTGSPDVSTLNLAQQLAIQQLGQIRSELLKVKFELLRKESELQHQLGTKPIDPTAAVINKDLAPSKGDPAVKAATEPPATVVAAAVTGTPAAAPMADGKQAATVGTTAAAATAVNATAALDSDPQLRQLIEADPKCAAWNHEIERTTAYIQQTERSLHPAAAATQMVKYHKQIADAHQRIAERAVYLKKMMNESIAAGTMQVNGIPAVDLGREIAILKTHERHLQDELKKQEAESRKIGTSSIDVEMLEKDIEANDKIVAGVAEELEHTKIELNADTRITILSRAVTPVMGESKKRIPLTAAAGAFGLFAPLLILLALDLRRQFVNGRQTMSDQMMPILGSLPLVPRRYMRRLEDDKDKGVSVWRERLAESVAAVTSLLLHKLEVDGHRVVMITSATPGEGKSTLAQQLATSLAISGHRTLLIDFDLRRPMLHRRFNTPLEVGVTDVLRRGMELEQAVRVIDSSNLSILTAGSCPGSLLQDAANGSLKTLFDLLRSKYEIVIVDSSPLLPIMDGRLVGRYADAAIVSVIKDVSQVPNLTSARDIMADYGIPVMGCVVTGDSSDSYYASYMNVDVEASNKRPLSA